MNKKQFLLQLADHHSRLAASFNKIARDEECRTLLDTASTLIKKSIQYSFMSRLDNPMLYVQQFNNILNNNLDKLIECGITKSYMLQLVQDLTRYEVDRASKVSDNKFHENVLRKLIQVVTRQNW